MNFFKKFFGFKERVQPIEDIPDDVRSPNELPVIHTPPEPSAPLCPYCSHQLNKKPQRKTKCPHCGKPIYVRSRPNGDSQILITEEGIIEIEKEWELNNLEREYQRVLQYLGISEDQYQIRKNKWARKLNNHASYRDFIWPIFNELLTVNAGNFHQQKMIYLEMVMFLSEEGKDSFKLRQLAAKAELHYYDQSGVKTVEVLSSGEQSCLHCQKLDGEIFTIKEALETMPIPCKDCTSSYGYCRCCYVGREMK